MPTITYNATLDNTTRTMECQSVTERPGGDVDVIRLDGTSVRFYANTVLAVNGVERNRGNPSERLAKSVPMPKRSYGYSGSGRDLDLFNALRASRTLRTVVEAIRAESGRKGGWQAFEVTDRFFDVAVTHDADGNVSLRPAADFCGNVQWDAKTRRTVARAVFKALIAWGVLAEREPDESGVQSDTVDVRRSFIFREEFVSIARTLFAECQSGYRTLTSPAWAWFGLTESDVEWSFCDAHSRGLLWYQSCGSVVELKFPAPGRAMDAVGTEVGG